MVLTVKLVYNINNSTCLGKWNEDIVLKKGGSLHKGFVSEKVGDNPEIQFIEVGDRRFEV